MENRSSSECEIAVGREGSEQKDTKEPRCKGISHIGNKLEGPSRPDNKATTPATKPSTNNPTHVAVFMIEELLPLPVVELDPLPLDAVEGAGGDPPPWTKYDFIYSWKDVVIVVVSFPSTWPMRFAWPGLMAHETPSPT